MLIFFKLDNYLFIGMWDHQSSQCTISTQICLLSYPRCSLLSVVSPHLRRNFISSFCLPKHTFFSHTKTKKLHGARRGLKSPEILVFSALIKFIATQLPDYSCHSSLNCREKGHGILFLHNIPHVFQRGFYAS